MISVLGIIGAVGVTRMLVAYGRPAAVDRAAKELAGSLRMARMQAINGDAHFRLAATNGASSYQVQRLDPATGAWSDVRTGRFTPPITFTAVPPASGTPARNAVEFDARGLMVQPTSDATFNVQDSQVLAASAVRILPSGQIQQRPGTVY